MTIRKTNLLRYILILLLVSTGLMLASPSKPVFADHTIPHCEATYPGEAARVLLNNCFTEVYEQCNPLGVNTPEWYGCVGLEDPGATPSEGSPDGGDISAGLDKTNVGVSKVTNDTCGSGDSAVSLSINVGCSGEGSAIMDFLSSIITFAGAGVGFIITIVFAVAGVQYIAARGNPQAIESAKKRIGNASIALGTFIFLYALLQWLIPGGVF